MTVDDITSSKEKVARKEKRFKNWTQDYYSAQKVGNQVETESEER